MSASVCIEDDQGKGRPFVILAEKGRYTEFAVHLFEVLATRTRTLRVSLPTVDDGNWDSLTAELLSQIEENSIRQTSIVALGPATAIAQNLVLQNAKLVRTLVVVDPSTRPHPTLLSKVIDGVERALPLGLPFRSSGSGFDGAPFLQRIRCPVLVVTSHLASAYQKEQAALLGKRVPTAWEIALPREREIEVLAETVLDFQQVPAKCPQKNVRKSAAG